jgi:hexosaminidase
MKMNTGRLSLDSAFGFEIQGYRSERLQGAVQRALKRIEERSGFTLSQCHGGDCRASLLIVADTRGEDIQSTKEDESYSLDINSERAVLHSHTEIGAMRGLETLVQALAADRNGFFWPALKVDDNPRFPWRGLLVDPARHWLSVELIKRLLDGMAVVKLNVLHWHLSDDQGFRVESLVFPRLHKMGSNGQYYRQSEIREIVAYARDRGIRVVPEFDMPGHAHSWFIGYPELASAPGPYQFKYYLGGDSVPMDPTREETYVFIDKFVGEMAALFPDRYWHIGGDEVDGTPWIANPTIQAFEKQHGIKNNAALQAHFNHRLSQILRRHGKKMMGWDEVINPDLPKDTVVQSWQGQESLALTAKQGYDSILSAPYYLDKMFPTSTYYAGDPLPAHSELSPVEAAHVLGGEVCVWGELVSEENIESRTWPYAAAVAERLWSPREVSDAQDMYRRLDIVSIRLEEAGSRHRSNMEAMLRRAAGGDVPPLVKDFVGLLQPLRLGVRQELNRPTQLTPLTTLGDIVVADPPDARRFASQVDTFVNGTHADLALRSELLRQLDKWKRMKSAVTVLADHAPIFREAEATASDLGNLAVSGEEAISYLSNQTSPSAAWREQQKIVLDQASQPKGLLRIAVLDTMSKLIQAVK